MGDARTDPTPLTAVVMAKRPDAGRVKTRLVRDEGLDAAGAAEIAWSMLTCIVARLVLRYEVVLALSPDADPAGWPTGAEHALFAHARSGPGGIVAQGEGTLGERLDRVWRQVGVDRPVAFFGGDSPDVPASALDGIAAALSTADIAIGPTTDGGYWTLAARVHRPEVLVGIDWGGATVYDQSHRRARAAGAIVATLPTWHDVDRPSDLDDLQRRLAARRDHRSSQGGSTDVDERHAADDDALEGLARSLERLRRPRRQTPT